ncbi:hypothetical protein TIFTF001_038136 [Ficus carica]|uniref:NB-ARC domain-containing protein n=1 Tax=Ficus carica TaxID=3494 RepID=A0AA88E786_FICCA|nr:hypothetical protein TIFTF001_038136 [Ficus carica]
MIEICEECLPTDVECESLGRPRKVMRLTLPAFSKTACEKEIEPKIQEIIDTLKLLLEQKTHLGLEETSVHNGPYNSQRLLATSIVEGSDVYGREDDKEKIIDLLLSNDDSSNKIRVIPIVGMGGIGKTTLAGLVYNNDRVRKSFDVKAWVTVSLNFDALRITKTILQNVEKSDSQAHDNKDLNQLQEALKKALKGRKFFFVLDDVWNKKYNLWHEFMRAFDTEARGSKLIVTTRDENIASMVAPNVRPHQLGAISDEECRKLLAKHVFCNGSSSAYPNMEVISRKIVERCKGLPLAVISLAGLLRAQPNPKEWERILHADIWEMQNNDDVEILPSLWLSYHYLPPHLKRCFAYCSLFPHDYEFSKKELILLWRAENLLAIQKGQRPKETGEDYFNDLVARSLFRRTPGLTYVMHDLLPSLEELYISGFDELERIGDEFFSSSTSSTIVPFRSLKKLVIQFMRSWKEWSRTTAYGEAGVLPSLTCFYIWNCEQLVSLLPGEPQQQTHTPFPSLETLFVETCPMLETFLEWGSFSRLQSIHIQFCGKLFALRRNWDLRRFTSLTSLELGDCYDSLVGSFPEEGLLPTTLTSLTITDFEYIELLNGKSLQQLTSLERLSIVRCEKLRSLPEERLPPSLSFLRIHNCPFLEGRCQRENGEDWHKIDHISRRQRDGTSKKRKAAEKAVPKARMSDEDRNLVRGAKINYIYVDGVMEIIWCSDFVC